MYGLCLLKLPFQIAIEVLIGRLISQTPLSWNFRYRHCGEAIPAGSDVNGSAEMVDRSGSPVV